MTMNPDFQYQAKHVDQIVVRPFNFEFPEDIDPLWANDNPVRSHLFNGFSLTMPYLEPAMVRLMKEAMQEIDHPELLDDMRQFNAQESRHYRCHRSFNELIKKNGYPELAEVEAKLDASYKRFHKRSVRARLAFAAGFETMTNGFTNWFINKRVKLFAGACPWVASFWVMHMVEEAEHKTVAYDAYMAYSGDYLPRAFGVLHGSFNVFGYGVLGMLRALQIDGLLWKPKTWWGIAREIGILAYNVGPFLLRAMLPGFNPRKEAEPPWMYEWIAGHATLDEGAPTPLLDTNDPLMPVPFEAKAST